MQAEPSQVFMEPLAEASLGFNAEWFHPDNIVDRGGLEPPTSPKLGSSHAKGLDGLKTRILPD